MAVQHFSEAKRRVLDAAPDRPLALFRRSDGLFKTAFDTPLTRLEIKQNPEMFLGWFSKASDEDRLRILMSEGGHELKRVDHESRSY